MRLDQHLEGGKEREEGELFPPFTHVFMKRGPRYSILTEHETQKNTRVGNCMSDKVCFKSGDAALCSYKSTIDNILDPPILIFFNEKCVIQMKPYN